MIVAVTYENGMVFQHFGHTAQFKLYMVENNAVQESRLLPTGASGHGALASTEAGSIWGHFLPDSSSLSKK